ncbi:MAG TPA: hypothetical protein VN857_11970 [Chthoniobacterales bacterium]|nr:hypothetical protein [Chthoniobacterales bacterium]
MVARTKVAALDKAARTAIILSGLFGFLIFFVKDVQPAVFGTFADLVMANYDPKRNKRVVQVITLTICGVVMIAWGNGSVDAAPCRNRS